MIVSNTQELLDYIYEEQKIKFPNQTKQQTERKMRAEILELQQANLTYWNTGSKQDAEAIMYEKADVIIMANRLYQEYQDEVAWLILSELYNYETAKFVKAKWDIVKNRPYIKDKNGNYQHTKECNNGVKIY